MRGMVWFPSLNAGFRERLRTLTKPATPHPPREAGRFDDTVAPEVCNWSVSNNHWRIP
jgi:hypothetical protein